jgi:stage V sporulation protein G
MIFEVHESGLAVTDVQVRLVENERLRGWATITLNDSFVVKGIRIIQGKTRIFVAMPSKQQKDGKYQDIAHPITPDFRTYLENCVLDVFNRLEEEDGYRPSRVGDGDLEDVGRLDEDAPDF